MLTFIYNVLYSDRGAIFNSSYFEHDKVHGQVAKGDIAETILSLSTLWLGRYSISNGLSHLVR